MFSPASIDSRGVTRTEVLTALLMCLVLGSLLSFAMGRDLNWDYYNYHGYAAFDVFGERLSNDFFAASIQGYLNRLAHLPVAMLERSGAHSLWTSTVLASLHSLNAFFLYLIARDLTIHAHRQRLVAAAITVLGCASGAVLLQLGSTFFDLMATAPVMAGIWLLLRASNWRSLLWAGLLVGTGVALKLTAAPFAAGILVAATVARSGIRHRLQDVAAAALGLALGFSLLYGYWGWKLYLEFGSPVFPLFNAFFRAPDFGAQSSGYHRFVPQTAFDVLRLPFSMIEHRSWVYVETVAPDLRPALLAVLAGPALLVTALRQPRGRGFQVRGSSAMAALSSGPLPALTVFFVMSTVGWILTSGNGRYAAPLLLLLGPMLFAAADAIVGLRAAGVVCLVALVCQVLLVVDAGNPRWSPNPWTAKWLPAEVPADLKSNPYLFVATSTSSESYVAAHVHPDSVFVNPIGLSSIPTNGPGWSRFVNLRDRFVGRTKVIFPAMDDAETLPKRVATMNGAIDRLGLALDPSRCAFMRFNGDSAGVPYLWGSKENQRDTTRAVLACDALAAPPSSTFAIRRAKAAEVMDGFERKCPLLFSPNGTQVEGTGSVWSRLYGKFDLFVVIDEADGRITYRMQRQASDVEIGNISTWRADVEAFKCRLPHGGSRGMQTLQRDDGR